MYEKGYGMIVAGLTGNYGMGKSSVTAMFRKLGAYTLDSDEIVDGLMREESVRGQITGFLGEKVLNAGGRLNKRAIAEIIFNDTALRKKLEALLHPLVWERVNASVKHIGKKNGVVIVEVPLLFEGKFQNRFDRTITVHTNRKTALARLDKKGIARKDALLRMKAQMDIRIKKKLSDFCINNSGTKSRTEAQVRNVLQSLAGEDRLKINKGQRRS